MKRTRTFAILIGTLLAAGSVHGQGNVEQIVAQKVQPILPKSGEGGGVAVAVRANGRTDFFNYGFANDARNERVTPDSIFNLGSVGKLFATTTLAEAVKRGELSLGDSVAKYVTELQRGGDIRRITLGQLASHTSGLPRTPQERGHRGKYTWPDFVRWLNSRKAGPNHEPGQQYLYSNAAMVLLRVALERRFNNTRFAALMRERITGPLGMNSTALPLPRELLARAVQGYGPTGRPIGQPGTEAEGIFKWPGAGQIYSSSRDMATFLTANMGELEGHDPIENAMAFAQQPVFTVSPRLKLGLAWQNVSSGNLRILDKNGGLNNTSTYIGFAPQSKLGVVILVNRGKQHATLIGRQILHALAQDQSPPSTEGEPEPDRD